MTHKRVTRYTFACESLISFQTNVRLLGTLTQHNVRVIFLSGPLGAGKTTFAREWLRAIGVTGAIKSPSYSMIETYQDTDIGVVHHLDLYRINSNDEIRCLGLEEYIEDHLVIEWPEKGIDQIVKYDLSVDIQLDGDSRLITLKTQCNTLAERLTLFAEKVENQRC